MIRFQCESCGRLKGDGETWILGFAAENIGVTSARREISIASSWDRPRAVESFAVHFCSDECRATYMTALFGDSPDTLGGSCYFNQASNQTPYPRCCSRYSCLGEVSS